MDFEKIDFTYGDLLDPKDIVEDEGNFHQIINVESDDDVVLYRTYNLSTGDEDHVGYTASQVVDLYRAY